MHYRFTGRRRASWAKLAFVRATDVIAAKRDGHANGPDDIESLIAGYVRGEVADYQVSAWLMAAYINGLSESETLALTHALSAGGETLDLSSLPEPRVDKHSTGGIGDKTSMVLVPLLAACGCTVVKMSGRGLGITGGTVDKLESIPGFRTELSPDEMVAVARKVGCCLAAQSSRMAPGDKLVYALRDVTATVDSIPLITASIMSKKLAAGADVISLDVKCGCGAFMTSINRARELAAALIRVGRGAGRTMGATITDMSAPLGYAVGNALEVAEAIDTHNGCSPPRFRQLCIELAGETLALAGLAPDIEAGKQLADARLADGSAKERFARLLEAQGADPGLVDRASSFRALIPTELASDSDGWIAGIDARIVGEVVLDLGAGRREKDDKVDPAVGVELAVSVGDRVERRMSLARIYARTPEVAIDSGRRIRDAIQILPTEVDPPPLILDRL